MCLALCNPMDCSLPGSSVHGIFQARVLEWVAFSFSRGSSWPRDRTQVSHIASKCFTIWATREAHRCLDTKIWKLITFVFQWLFLFSCPVVSDSLQPCGLEHARLPCPSLSPKVCSNSCPLSRWCYLPIQSSATFFSFGLQSFPASGSFPVSQFFASGGQSFGPSASVLAVNIQGWFPLGLTALISLLSKGLSRVFSSTTIQKH